MILLNSIWLFALAALSIPVAIHLWNIRQGKTLKVGSIALISASAQKSSRSFKLHNLLLLLLRCLLLALLAFVLALPFWQDHNSSPVKGWLLIPKENIKESYMKFKPAIDSLFKAGYQFHYFNNGFQKQDLNKVLSDDKHLKPGNDSLNKASYWSLVQQLDGTIPSSLPVYLFTPNNINHFSGSKPEISLNLNWKTYIPADSTSTWVEKAWLANNNDIQVVQGTSKPEGTYYTNHTIQSADHANTPFILNTVNGRLTVSLKNSNEPVAADTSAWHFAIYAEKNNPDAGYIKAALESIVQFTKHKAVIKLYADANQIRARQNWVFWLSEKSAGKQIAQNCDNLFAYETGKTKNINSWINDDSESLSPHNIFLYKSVIANPDNGKTVWHDGFGNPVLICNMQQHTDIYHFYSRFDPSWSDLVWNDNFPKMLLRLIFNTSPNLNEKHERRIIDTKQLLPVINEKGRTSTNKIIERTNLSHLCWLLLVLVFIAERWLANKKPSRIAGKQISQNG
jgi:hypothetical protein